MSARARARWLQQLGTERVNARSCGVVFDDSCLWQPPSPSQNDLDCSRWHRADTPLAPMVHDQQHGGAVSLRIVNEPEAGPGPSPAICALTHSGSLLSSRHD